MKTSHNASRRNFLKLSTGAGVACMSSLGLGLMPKLVQAAGNNLTDYKALVCVYLNGGNDGNNVIVPLEPTRYAAYQSIRGGLALVGNKLLAPISDQNNQVYALHYGLPEVNALYQNGKVAFVLNTGMLHRPLTRSQYLQGLYTPSNLFSHSDQTLQTQTGQPTTNGVGWGGQLLDNLGGASDSLAAVSVSSPALLLQGHNVSGNVVTPGTNLSLAGMNIWPQTAANARRQAVESMLALNGGNLFRQAANQAMLDGLALADALQSNAQLPSLNTAFPGTNIGNQMKEILKMIRIRAAQGPGRQVFFCSMDGFDTHSGQDWQHWNLLHQLSAAMAAFYDATVEIGLENQITAFTQSEFGRTLQSNGSGSDHAWGNHQMVVGGAVHGGVYGTMPTFALNQGDDANGRGVWIPKISTAQFAATLGRWFGASDADLAAALPNLALFANTTEGTNIGFMG